MFNLKDHAAKSDMMAAVSGMSYVGGTTITWDALIRLRIDGFSAANGARPRSQGYRHIAIVLTDGGSNNSTATKNAAKQVHDADIVVNIYLAKRYFTFAPTAVSRTHFGLGTKSVKIAGSRSFYANVSYKDIVVIRIRARAAVRK